MNWADLCQLYLAATSLAAIYLAMDRKPRVQRWAPIFGLLAQPMWFYLTWDQWGMRMLCGAYTLLWLRGLYHQWIKP